LGKSQPKLVNAQLAAAMSHPTRVYAMAILGEREASPKEIAAEIDEPVNNVTYHVDKLVGLGCIELVRTEPVKGGRVVEHYYRATRRAWVDEQEWNSLGPAEQHMFTSTLMRAVSADINEAMATGVFFERDDNHLSRTPLFVDVEAWDEVTSLLDATLQSLLDIRAKAAERVAAPDNLESFPMKVEILQFQAPSKGP
jgi:DNA-binding transcriptional ArsR family regulator